MHAGTTTERSTQEIVSAYADAIVAKLRQHDEVLYYRELKELTRPPFDWSNYTYFNTALKLAVKQGRIRKSRGVRAYKAVAEVCAHCNGEGGRPVRDETGWDWQPCPHCQPAAVDSQGARDD